MSWRRLFCGLVFKHMDAIELGRDNIRARGNKRQHLSHCRFCDKIYWRTLP